MDEITKIETVDQYDQLFGLESTSQKPPGQLNISV